MPASLLKDHHACSFYCVGQILVALRPFQLSVTSTVIMLGNIRFVIVFFVDIGGPKWQSKWHDVDTLPTVMDTTRRWRDSKFTIITIIIVWSNYLFTSIASQVWESNF